MIFEIIIGFSLSLLISATAYWRKSLNLSGMITAIIIGTLIYWWGTILVWSAMILFFISSSLLTKKDKKKKLELENEKNGRNWIQVLANGGVGLLFSFLNFIFHEPSFVVAGIVSMAASNSDTWGSEIGKALRGKTFFITNFKEVPVGLSGGISLWGTVASLGGAFVISSFSVIMRLLTNVPFFYSWWEDLLLISGMGFFGSILDSYLGALVQAKYYDKTKDIIFETPQKDKKIPLVAGFWFINNDMVNFLATLITTLITLFFIFR